MYYNIQRKGTKIQVHFSHSYTILLSILRLSAALPPVSRGGNLQACKWFVFRMYISGTFNKMRGYGFINDVFCFLFYFLGYPILTGFHRLANVQDVMGLVVQVRCLLPPVSPHPHFLVCFLTPRTL